MGMGNEGDEGDGEQALHYPSISHGDQLLSRFASLC
jgi:hypothetical protein